MVVYMKQGGEEKLVKSWDSGRGHKPSQSPPHVTGAADKQAHAPHSSAVLAYQLFQMGVREMPVASLPSLLLTT